MSMLLGSQASEFTHSLNAQIRGNDSSKARMFRILNYDSPFESIHPDFSGEEPPFGIFRNSCNDEIPEAP